MGLDIYHYKATLEKPQVENIYDSPSYIFTEDEIEESDVSFSWFQRYIQELNYFDWIEIHLIDNPKMMDLQAKRIEQLRKFSNDIFLVNADPHGLERQLKEIEISQQLVEVPVSYNLDPWITKAYYRPIKRKGFYYTEVGYQRKGMNKGFYEHFGSPSFRARYEEFEYAFSCLEYPIPDPTGEEFNYMRNEFKKSFLDNYEEGASIMVLSY